MKKNEKKQIQASYHHGDLKQALIDAANKILDEEGYEELTLRKCAKAAGVSASAPMHHFPSISDLFASIAAKSLINLIEEAVESVRNNKKKKANKAELLGKAYINYAKNKPARYRIIFSHKVNVKNTEYTEAIKYCFSTMANFLKEIYPKDSDKAIHSAVLKMWCTIHGYSNLVLDDRIEFLSELALFQKSLSIEEVFFKTLHLDNTRSSDIF